jgi:hypothetical protein
MAPCVYVASGVRRRWCASVSSGVCDIGGVRHVSPGRVSLAVCMSPVVSVLCLS